ncbi:MAG TPA: acyl-CoA dehydrogenase family protein [Acidimicrobiales bacterium]|nr:acyl-CoA dehydrogenase family protein [Acidimicrobiales bacterium]
MTDTRTDTLAASGGARPDDAFRAELVAWLEEHPPPDVQVTRMPDPDDPGYKRVREWQRELADAGYVAVTYPRRYGGRDGTPVQQMIVAEELRKRRQMVPTGIGVTMVAPTILAHGTDEQKERFIVPTLRGDLAWCQLYSEPGAGSDLAGLATRAVRDGDEWVVDGQKVWTTQAHIADYGILLARTDPDQPKHRGITYFLIDMHQPGIEVRPLRQVTGDAHFNEVFMTGARVPDENLLGDVNAGWGVAMTTLAHERVLMGGVSGGGGQDKSRGLIELAAKAQRTSDPVVRQALADAYIRSRILRYLGMRMRDGGAHAPHPSLLKYYNAHLQKRLNELALELEGPYGTLWDGDAPQDAAWQRDFLSALQLRIAGGTDQVQLNVIGERILGLPGEPRVDKDRPYREVANNPTRW